MAEVKSITKSEDGKKATVVFEVDAEDLSNKVVSETVRVLAMGLGNQMIVEHMDHLKGLFVDQFYVVIGKVLEQSGKDLQIPHIGREGQEEKK